MLLLAAAAAGHGGVQPLSRIAIHRARVALDASAAVRASPALLGTKVRPLCPLIRMLLFVLSSPRAWTIYVFLEVSPVACHPRVLIPNLAFDQNKTGMPKNHWIRSMIH